MNKEEVKKFLLGHKGYLKVSALRIADRCDCSFTVAKEALQEVKSFKKKDKNLAKELMKAMNAVPRSSEKPTIPEGFEISKMWTKANGEMGYSYKKKEETKNSVKEDIKEIVKGLLVSVSPVKTKKSTGANISLNIYMSDEHLGCDPSSGIYSFKYGPEEMKRRHLDILAKIADLAWVFGSFHKINIFNLGDSIDGQDKRTTRGGHALEQNMSNREVFSEFLAIQKLFLESVVELEVADDINWIGVANSNHGGDMEFFAFTAFKEFVNLKYPDIDFKVYEDFLNLHILDKHHALVLTHGKDEALRMRGLPLTLTDKDEKFLNEFIESNEEAIGDRKVHVVKGDLHESASYQAKKFRYKNCGSLLGASAWIMNNFGKTKGRTDYDVIIDDTVLEGNIEH